MSCGFCIVSPHHIQQLLDTSNRAVLSREERKPAEVDVDNENKKGPKVKASKLEFKMVNRMYDSPKSE
jgi:hypothetical protein